jgi:hypothetical protein
MSEERDYEHLHKEEKHRHEGQEPPKKGVGPMYTPRSDDDETDKDPQKYGIDKAPPYWDPDKPLDEG